MSLPLKSVSQSCPQGPTSDEHWLVTVLGTNPVQARYTLGSQPTLANLAPLALLDLLPQKDRPDNVLAICTPEAKLKTWPILQRDVARRKTVRVDCVEVPFENTENGIDAFLESVTENIPDEIDLTVDLTHGFRHFSFLTYFAVLYLQFLRGVRVRHAYYGLLRSDGPSYFLDLRSLLRFPRWIHALEVLNETGSFLPMVEALKHDPTTSSRQIEKELSYISQDFLSGLPLELGYHASLFLEQRLKPLKRRLKTHDRLPLSDDLVKRLGEKLETYALSTRAPGRGWKGQMSLSEGELKRQAGIVDGLLEHGNVATAVGLLAEWTVSWAVLRCYPESNWLDYQDVRRKAAGVLGAIQALGSDRDLADVLSDEQRLLGDFWRNVSDLRNGYHHHGMRPQVLVGEPKASRQLRKVRKYWCETLRCCPQIDLSLGESPGACVLVSPIGLRPGVLSSAINACRDQGVAPSTCVAICSRETKRFIAEAAHYASYDDELQSLVLEDPYGGNAEVDNLVRAARETFIGAGMVLVNVTGGTTLMGLASERLAEAARRLACPVRRFGLIDRRPPKEQRKDPYHASEIFWLDSEEDGRAESH